MMLNQAHPAFLCRIVRFVQFLWYTFRPGRFDTFLIDPGIIIQHCSLDVHIDHGQKNGWAQSLYLYLKPCDWWRSCWRKCSLRAAATDYWDLSVIGYTNDIRVKSSTITKVSFMWFHVFPNGLVSACSYSRDLVLWRHNSNYSIGLALEASSPVGPGTSSWSDICSIWSSFFSASMAIWEIWIGRWNQIFAC